MCGPDNVHEYKWICDGCGGLAIDDGDSATKCPGCSAAKGKKAGTEAAAPKSVLPKMKAVWDQMFLRAAETGAALPLLQHTKEAVEKAAKLEEDIQSLENIGG